jgi:hypothetical protein
VLVLVFVFVLVLVFVFVLVLVFVIVNVIGNASERVRARWRTPRASGTAMR